MRSAFLIAYSASPSGRGVSRGTHSNTRKDTIIKASLPSYLTLPPRGWGAGATGGGEREMPRGGIATYIGRRADLYLSTRRSILVDEATYIGSPSDQYRFIAPPSQAHCASPPLHSFRLPPSNFGGVRLKSGTRGLFDTLVYKKPGIAKSASIP